MNRELSGNRDQPLDRGFDPSADGRSRDDRRMSAALQNEVTLPPGLSDRLLAAVAASTASPSAPIRSSELVEVVTLAAPGRLAESVGQLAAPARRRWVWAAAAAAASVALALSIWQWRGPRELADPLATSASWIARLESQWSDRAAPAEFGPPAMVAPLVRGWQWLDVRSRLGVAWRLAPRDPASSGYLFVVRRALGQQFGALPDLPPREPQSSTGGRSCGLWQSESVVYLLAVSGDAGQYRGYLRSPDLAMNERR